MSEFQTMQHDDGSTAIWLSVCSYPDADAVVDALGHTPNGYFWNGVAERLMEGALKGLAEEIETDPEGDTFVARSTDAKALQQLEAAMLRLLTDPPALEVFVRQALDEGFDFDD